MSDRSYLAAIIIGSDSDRPLLEKSKVFNILKACQISYKVSVISADRNPGILRGYCAQARADGVKVFIGAAGMSGRLPGSIAAETKYRVPVIGVAIPTKEFADAIDAMLGIARSPAGCPVILAGIGRSGFDNAALISAQILGMGEDEESKRIKKSHSDYLCRLHFQSESEKPQINCMQS
ncbi:MAG: AIR carboxylase family protein [Candidatus Pacebacteria bacterium]|nr:AIR carboxylase family protein [Candidatus Paceibacterota bacterium]